MTKKEIIEKWNDKLAKAEVKLKILELKIRKTVKSDLPVTDDDIQLGVELSVISLAVGMIREFIKDAEGMEGQ